MPPDPLILELWEGIYAQWSRQVDQREDARVAFESAEEPTAKHIRDYDIHWWRVVQAADDLSVIEKYLGIDALGCIYPRKEK
jgi:hypothetical protein